MIWSGQSTEWSRTCSYTNGLLSWPMETSPRPNRAHNTHSVWIRLNTRLNISQHSLHVSSSATVSIWRSWVRIGEDSAPGTIICSSTVLAMKHELRIPFSIADSPVQLAPALSLANDTNGVPFVLFVCPEMKSLEMQHHVSMHFGQSNFTRWREKTPRILISSLFD